MENMKRHEVIIGGTGGQGVITIGYALAEAASRVYKNVSRFPIYLAMQRGGAAYCTVVFSNDEIAAPILSSYEQAIAMDNGSYDRFRDGVKKDGKLVYNSSLVKQMKERPGITQYAIPVNDMAKEMGAPGMANMIMLGAYMSITAAIDDELIRSAVEKILASEGKSDRLPQNIAAYEKGAQYAKEKL